MFFCLTEDWRPSSHSFATLSPFWIYLFNHFETLVKTCSTSPCFPVCTQVKLIYRVTSAYRRTQGDKDAWAKSKACVCKQYCIELYLIKYLRIFFCLEAFWIQQDICSGMIQSYSHKFADNPRSKSCTRSRLNEKDFTVILTPVMFHIINYHLVNIKSRNKTVIDSIWLKVQCTDEQTGKTMYRRWIMIR